VNKFEEAAKIRNGKPVILKEKGPRSAKGGEKRKGKAVCTVPRPRTREEKPSDKRNVST